MMSGGDLDGDVYMLIWEQKIVSRVILKTKDKFPEPSLSENLEWKDKYTEEMDKDADIAESIISYFQRDKLGQMSNLHLNLAIQKGIGHFSTEKAAYLCSIQVDFAKHGRCIKERAMLDL